jgi:hypothetical protein
VENGRKHASEKKIEIGGQGGDLPNDFLKYLPSIITCMKKKVFLVSGLLVLLIVFVLATGCAGSSPAANTTSQTTSVTTAPSTGPKYVVGDIVRNPKAGPASTAWLIMGYNSSTDLYQRAVIYPNVDGSWGYRRNSITDTESRIDFDKVFTEKITNKPPASIPIRQLTPVTTTTSAITGNTTQTVSTTTTTTSTIGKPTFKKIIPDEGTAGTTISIESLTGTNFKAGATVSLMKADSPNITATNVNVQSSTLITCTFNPPSNSTPGAWDVVITNPDGQYVQDLNRFTMRSPVGTVTTTSSSDSGGITSVSPAFTYGNDITGGMRITGTDFQQNFKAKLVKSTNSNYVIDARAVRWDSATQVTAWFSIPSERQRGSYNVIVTNPDGTTRTLLNGFEVR